MKGFTDAQIDQAADRMEMMANHPEMVRGMARQMENMSNDEMEALKRMRDGAGGAAAAGGAGNPSPVNPQSQMQALLQTMKKFSTLLTIIILSQSQIINFTMANTILNKKWILKEYPKGKFDASRDAELIEEKIDLGIVTDEKIVVEVQSLSVDAFVRTMVSAFLNFVQEG